MSTVAYGRYEEAFKAIHSALSSLMAPPTGRRITRLEFTWNVDGTQIIALKAYDGALLLFTVSLAWNLEGTLREVARTDA
jgi:hypothetical protein